MQSLKVSLVIPIRNEADSIEVLIESIARQTLPPDEVVLVDGGSTDSTVEIVERLADGNAALKLIKTEGATPGKGRNLGVEAAQHEWIAFTDAGIKLEENWLEELAKASDYADVVYGNYSPVTNNLFTRCASLAYVPPQSPKGIRGKFIASSLMNKKVWEKVGGFPDHRAAEDLMFMEQAEALGFRVAVAPRAMAHWQLRPDLATTFQKFVVYSKHNVWAGRQWDWHYGVLKQYLLLAPFLLLAALHSWWWLLAMPLWLFVRTAKRISMHRYEYGLGPLFNPIVFFLVAFLVLVIDAATFVGWVQALRRTTPSADHRDRSHHPVGEDAATPPRAGGEPKLPSSNQEGS